jgi:hypothetical protein
MMLLSKVVRNSELMTDAELKRSAVGSALKHWSSFICLFLNSFERFTASAANSSEVREAFEKLPAQAKGYIEHFIKVLLPVLTTQVVYGSLGTDKLRGVFDTLLQDDQPLVTQMILAFLLLDVASANRSNTGVAIKKVEEFIKGHGTRYLNELISMKLLTMYYTPNIGKANRERIERIYAQTQLKARGLSSGKEDTSRTKDRIVRSLREARENVVDDESERGS